MTRLTPARRESRRYVDPAKLAFRVFLYVSAASIAAAIAAANWRGGLWGVVLAGCAAVAIELVFTARPVPLSEVVNDWRPKPTRKATPARPVYLQQGAGRVRIIRPEGVDGEQMAAVARAILNGATFSEATAADRSLPGP